MRISDWSSDVCSSDLTRCTKSDFPDHFPCLRVKSPKITVRVSDKGKSAGGCERRSGERNALLHIPTLFHRADVERGESTETAIRAGHFDPITALNGNVRTNAAATDREFDRNALQRATHLQQRNHQDAIAVIVAHRLPIVAAEA